MEQVEVYLAHGLPEIMAVTLLGNIGPAFCRAGPMSNYSVFSDFSLTVLSFLMVAGRLELVTFFVLFTPRFWDPHH